MGGFLSGLGTLLGGFNVARRIDEDGFDWREKQAQEEWERQRKQQVAGQEDEKYGLGLATNYMLGTDEPDMALAGQAFGPNIDQARRELLLGSALGRTRESKPYIKQLEHRNRLAEEEVRQGGRVEILGRMRGSLRTCGTRIGLN